MGGYGSGRYSYTGRATTDNMLALDIRRMYRGGWLTPGHRFNWKWSRYGERIADIGITVADYYLTLDYNARQGGEQVPQCYPVSLTWTACHLGGQRPWFLCPRCGRRVAVLYGGMIFACRHCQRLVYASQREDVMSRAMRRTQKIQARLGWDDECGLKPKGMHWRTFEQLERAHEYFDRRALLAMAVKHNLIP